MPDPAAAGGRTVAAPLRGAGAPHSGAATPGFTFGACMALALAVLLAPLSGRAAEPKLWFQVGEELVYDIHWGVFHVGQTRVTTEWTNHAGRTAVHVRYATRTNRFVENFYPVDDTLESLIDAQTFLPVYFRKKLSEGRYRCDEITTFDFDKLEMRWESKLNGRTKVLPIEKDTRDIIGMMYYLRGQPFEVGTTNQYRVMADEKLYDLLVPVRETDTMKVGRWGKRTTYRVEPKASFQGLFVRKGKITFWVSDDPRRLCTRIMATVPVANIRLTLADVKGPGDDFWITAGQAKE
jgi:hypothetical protein